MSNKPHISVSQLGMLSRCGEAYRRRYIDGDIIPPGVAQLKGTCMHESARVNGLQKIDTHADMHISDLKEAAAAKFDEQLKGDGIWLNDDESRRGKRKVIGEAKDHSVQLAAFYGEQIAPDYQPAHVEETFRIELPGSRDLLGIIDLIDDKGRVVDYKTAARSSSQGDADKSLQLTAYNAGHIVLTGESPSELRLDVVVKTPKRTTRQVLTTERTAADNDVLAARVNAAIKVIEAGAFAPADPSWWGCSAKFCGYWHSCPYAKKG